MTSQYTPIQNKTVGIAEGVINKGRVVTDGTSVGLVKQNITANLFPILGIAINNYKANNIVVTTTVGECYAIASGAISIGDKIGADVLGKVKTTTIRDDTIGFARESASADGDIIKVNLIVSTKNIPIITFESSTINELGVLTISAVINRNIIITATGAKTIDITVPSDRTVQFKSDVAIEAAYIAGVVQTPSGILSDNIIDKVIQEGSMESINIDHTAGTNMSYITVVSYVPFVRYTFVAYIDETKLVTFNTQVQAWTI